MKKEARNFLLAWVGFIAFTVAMVFIGPILFDLLNKYSVVRLLFNLMYFLVSVAIILGCVYLFISAAIQLYRDSEK